MLHYLCVGLRITIIQSHTNTMQQIRTHKAVTRRVENKKLLSRRRQLEYRMPLTSVMLVLPCVQLTWPSLMWSRQFYAGTVKHHNVCKRHVAIGTGFKQTEHTIFLHVSSMGLKLQLLSSALWRNYAKIVSKFWKSNLTRHTQQPISWSHL